VVGSAIKRERESHPSLDRGRCRSQFGVAGAREGSILSNRDGLVEATSTAAYWAENPTILGAPRLTTYVA
jgi:hypothetical protein